MKKESTKVKVQRYSAVGALQGTSADQEGKSVNSKILEFSILQNCYVDKRIGAVLRRGGSALESITPTGRPTVIGEQISIASGGTVPVTSTILMGFSGNFKARHLGVWGDVDKTDHTLFDTIELGSTASLGGRLYIANGRPAVWAGDGTTIERMGIPAPSSSLSVTPIDTGSDVTRGYMFTYYNATTGLESDWSPVTVAVDGEISRRVTFPAVSSDIPATATHIRLYRTFERAEGGSSYYLVEILDIGTTTYLDELTDEDLTDRAPDIGENLTPPATSKIIHAYGNRLWMVDGPNHFILRFSKPYTGNDAELERFPSDFFIVSREPVTGLLAIPGRMLVFHPRSISYISGSSEDDFQFQPWKTGIGTLFHNSIATNGDSIICLSEQGWVDITKGAEQHISREIDHDLQPILKGQYNSFFYAGAVWNPSIRQFLCFVSGRAHASEVWVDDETGSLELWEDDSAMTSELWEDDVYETIESVIRVKMWGWSPELSGGGVNRWMEYTFNNFLDDNEDPPGLGQFPMLLFHPSPSSEQISPQQEGTIIAYYDETLNTYTGGSRVLRSFDTDLYLDGAQAIPCLAVTSRLQPGEESGNYKLFQAVEIPGAYLTRSGNSYTYLLDLEDPQIDGGYYDWDAAEISFNSSPVTDMRRTTQQLARHMRLVVRHTPGVFTNPEQIILSEIYVHYRERFRSTGR